MSNNYTKTAISYHVKLKLTIQSTENVSYDLIFLFSVYNGQGYFVKLGVIQLMKRDQSRSHLS